MSPGEHKIYGAMNEMRMNGTFFAVCIKACNCHSSIGSKYEKFFRGLPPTRTTSIESYRYFPIESLDLLNLGKH